MGAAIDVLWMLETYVHDLLINLRLLNTAEAAGEVGAAVMRCGKERRYWDLSGSRLSAQSHLPYRHRWAWVNLTGQT